MTELAAGAGMKADIEEQPEVFSRLLDRGAGPIADLLMSFLPSYAEPWLKIAVYYPFATTLVLCLLLFTWRTNGYLRDRIQERARLAWNRPANVAANTLAASWLLPVAKLSIAWRSNHGVTSPSEVLATVNSRPMIHCPR